jgi:hypothetical protein
MKNQIDRTIQKTWQYWYVDGLVEIAAGVVILALAALYALAAAGGNGPLVAITLGIGQPLIILGGMVLAGKAVRHFKERLTFPRTGYVSYPKPKKRHRLLSMAIGMVVSISVVAGLTYLIPRIGEHVTPFLTAFFMSLFLAYLGWRLDLKRFYLAGGLVLATGLLSAALRLPQDLGSILVLTVLGLCNLVAGGLVLHHYLVTTTPVEA